jgi:hypothetical protein
MANYQTLLVDRPRADIMVATLTRVHGPLGRVRPAGLASSALVP